MMVRVLCAGMVVAAALSAGTAIAQPRIACDAEYSVRRGDTLRNIAIRAYGDDNYDRIWSVNRRSIGRNPNQIEVGTLLTIPCPPGRAPAEAKANFKAAPGATAHDETAAGPQPTVRIVFNRSAPADFVLNTGIIDPLLAQIERETEGRVVFVDPDEVNTDPRGQLDLVRSGKVDGAYILNAYLGATDPLIQITMHPMVGGTAQQTATALWRVYKDRFEAAGSFGDVKLLGFVGAPPAQIWTVPGEAAALTGEQAWTAPYAGGTAPAEGAVVPAGGQPAATYALAHGAAHAVGLWTRATAVTEIEGGLYAPTFSVFLSREAWDRIGPADREVIARLTGEALAARSVAWDAADNVLRTAMMRKGLAVRQADFDTLAEIQDRARVGLEAWMAAADARGVAGYEALEAYYREIREMKGGGES